VPALLACDRAGAGSRVGHSHSSSREQPSARPRVAGAGPGAVFDKHGAEDALNVARARALEPGADFDRGLEHAGRAHARLERSGDDGARGHSVAAGDPPVIAPRRAQARREGQAQGR